MTYLGREISRRLLPVVTFVLISFLISGKLVRARPQENFVVASPQQSSSNSNVNSSDDRGVSGGSSSEIKEVVTEKTDQDLATVESDNRNDVNTNDVVETKNVTPEIIRSVTGAPVKFFAEYSVNSALDFGRAVAESSTTKSSSTSINTLKPLNKHLLSASASDMLISDVRTPPKIKSQINHSHAMQSMSTPGKGEAIPVVLDGNEEVALEKISSDNFKYTHSEATPMSGLSTWILLNSDSVSTPFSHKKVHKPVLYDVTNLTSTENSTDVKRKQKPNASSSTTENAIKSKIDAVVMKKPDRKPIATIQKVNQTHAKKPSSPKIDPDVIQTTTGVSLQDSKFKNKTPVIMGKVPITTAKIETNVSNTTPIVFLDAPVDNGTRLGTPVVTFPHVPVRQRPLSSTTRKPSISTTRPVSQPSPNSTPQRISSTPVEFTVISTSSLSTEAAASVSTEDSITTEVSTDTTTKKSTSSKKKKKKNKKKNKRRRPSTKKPARVQSKISEDDNSTSKLPNTALTTTGSRPLSTRIYNYLAREVMPNVGVGLVGLVLTAGLAGLLLYPFGAAVPIRRNYEKPNHPPYNLNDYPPINEVDNAQPEESVLSQVLAGMSNSVNQYSREQPDLVYKNPPKYKPARFDNLNTFTHLKDVKYTTSEKPVDDTGKYSELGDVVSGPHESVKFTSFDINDSIKYPSENSQPPSPSYPILDLTTSSQNDPVPYHKYKGTVSNSQPSTIVLKPESAYSTLGEYSSYNNANELIQSPVYTGESYDYKNHKQDQDMQEFKVSSDLEVVTQMTENQTTTSSPTSTTTTATINTVKPVRHEQPSFAALEGIPKNYRTLQTSIRFGEPASVLPMNQDFVPSEGMGVYATSVEHGPRSMRFRRKKRNVSSENELDSVLIDQHMSEKSTRTPVTTIPTEKMPFENDNVTTTITPNSTTNSSDISNEIFEFENVKVELSTESNMAVTTTTTTTTSDSISTTLNSGNSTDLTTEKTKDEATGSYQATCENCDLVNVEEPSPPAQTFSLGALLRKLLDFKLRLGLELIRATTEVIGRYLGNVQVQMTTALRNIQRGAFRVNVEIRDRNKKVAKRREKRHVKTILNKLE